MKITIFTKPLIIILLYCALISCSYFGQDDEDLRKGVSQPQKLSKDGTTIDPRDNSTVKKKKKVKKLKPTKLTKGFKSLVDVKTVWKKKIGTGLGLGDLRLEPSIDNESIYFTDYSGSLYALNMLNGKRLWSLKDKGTEYTTSPGIGSDLVLVGTSDGRIIARSKESGLLKWVAKLPSEILAKPLEGYDQIIVRSNDGSVYALDKETGQEIWNYQKTAPKLSVRGNSNPLLVDDSVIIGWDDGRMTALDLDTGKVIWNATVAVPTGQTDLERLVDIDGDPVLDGADIYVCSYGSGVTSVSSLDGKINWTREISSRYSPAVGDQNIYVVDDKSVIWAFNKITGNSVWRKNDFERRSISAPLIYKNILIVGDFDGYTHWLDTETGNQVFRKKIANEAIVARGVTDNSAIVLTAKNGKTTALEFNEN